MLENYQDYNENDEEEQEANEKQNQEDPDDILKNQKVFKVKKLRNKDSFQGSSYNVSSEEQK